MNKISRKGAARALVAVFMLSAPTQVHAQVRFSDLDKSIDPLMRNTQVNSVLPNQATVRANIDTRISQLRAQIGIALSRGWIRPLQAASLRNQLDIIQSMESRYHTVGLTAGEARDLIGRTRSVQDSINSTIATNRATGHTFARTIPREAHPMSNMENQRLYLSSRLDDAIKLGKISGSDAAKIRAQLDRITAMERAYNRPGRTATPEEQARLRAELADVNNRMHKYL